jgi:AbrB family looped-hinge helix DNA binding protein
VADKEVFVVVVSKQFRITIPIELRRKLDVRVGDEVVWILQGREALISFRRAKKQNRRVKRRGESTAKPDLSLKDLAEGKVKHFKTAKDLLEYLNSDIAKDKKRSLPRTS